MANRYLKAAGGNWNAAATWSATGSGGADNAGAPTAADEVILQVGSGQLTINAAAVCRSFEASAYTNTITHGAFSLTIGDGTTPTGNVAFVLNTSCTYTPNASSSIIFTSSAAGTHTINTGGKTIQTIAFNNTGSYRFVTSNVTVTGAISHTNGTIDFNGLIFSMGGSISTSGATARTLTFGSSIITYTGVGSFLSFSGSNFTITVNTAIFILTGASPNITNIPDGTNFNGASFKIMGSNGSTGIPNTCTIKNLIIDTTTTKTLAITSGKTLTLEGSMYCDPQGGQVTITGGTISKTSGTVNLYQIASNTCTFTGGATWNLNNNCDALDTLGLTKVGGNNYIDLVNGNDTIYNAYGFFKIAYTGATGTCPVVGETMIGSTSAHTAIVSHVNPYEWSTGSGTLFFKSKSDAFVAEAITGGTGSGHCDIAADFVNAAWLTITSGATAARHAPADENRISKTTNPISIGNGSWTNCQTGGGFPATKVVTATANASGLIRITISAHGYSQDDVIQLVSVGGTLEANGAWRINYVSATQFDLAGSAFVNSWTSGGTAQKINSKAVVLTNANLTLEVDRCKSNWSNGVTGISSLQSTFHKEGGAAIKCLASATPGTNTKQIYHAITIAGATINNYQKLSFWVYNSAAIADANTWYIALCSGADGTGVLDIIPIPAIASTARAVPMCIARNTGNNLGGNTSTAIASIAIYSGSTAPTAASYLYIDNIMACTTNGLSLVSLISKNGSAQGGTEGYYGIQSINGKVVLLDNDTNTLSNAGRGYSTTGTTPENVTTYIRDSFRTPVLGASSSTLIHTINDSGVFGYPISWQFGYNPVNGSCDGETFFDGGNGNGYGINSAKNYINFNQQRCFRFNYGFQTSGLNCYIISQSNCNCIDGNYNLGSIIIDNQLNNNNNLYGDLSGGGLNFIITNQSNNNNLDSGTYYSQTFSGKIISVYNKNNSFYALACYRSANIYIETIISINNGSGSIYNESGLNFFRNATLNENTSVGGMILGSAAEIRSIKEDGQEGNNWVYYYGATANWQIIEKQGSDPGSWKIILLSGGTGANRRSNYPVPIKLEGIQCVAGKEVTIVANVKKDHATDIVNQLKVYPDVVRGIGTVAPVLGTATTSWETITLKFTPTYACIAEVFYEVYSSNGNLSNAYLGSVNISQSV